MLPLAGFSQFQNLKNKVVQKTKDAAKGKVADKADAARDRFEGFLRPVPCSTCQGKRLKPLPLAVTIDGRNIADLAGLPTRTPAEQEKVAGFYASVVSHQHPDHDTDAWPPARTSAS